VIEKPSRQAPAKVTGISTASLSRLGRAVIAKPAGLAAGGGEEHLDRFCPGSDAR
jgi:hypothetical protein